ncbi:excisionase [Thiococcus pfennigii]|uniref:excisionase n=1 Tax=Thiococcus pfennigii TaxID=1057 RepID=UPI001906ECDF|nr:excisionase [Thiococcus pfennigii]MBK1732904.1 excisionase [Thiococcus pfennigii]
MTDRVDFVTIKRFSELSGYTEDAVRKKIKTGVWLEKIHYRRAPDGRLLMSLAAYHRWVEGKAA